MYVKTFLDGSYIADVDVGWDVVEREAGAFGESDGDLLLHVLRHRRVGRPALTLNSFFRSAIGHLINRLLSSTPD